MCVFCCTLALLLRDVLGRWPTFGGESETVSNAEKCSRNFEMTQQRACDRYSRALLPQAGIGSSYSSAAARWHRHAIVWSRAHGNEPRGLRTPNGVPKNLSVWYSDHLRLCSHSLSPPRPAGLSSIRFIAPELEVSAQRPNEANLLQWTSNVFTVITST